VVIAPTDITLASSTRMIEPNGDDATDQA